MNNEIPRCPHGHLLTPENSYIRPDRVNPKPRCRTCARERVRVWQAQKTQGKIDRKWREADAAYPKPTETDRAWAAGLFEGEGTITIRSGGTKGYTRPEISVTMTDPEPIRWLHERWGGGIGQHPVLGAHAKDAHVWSLGSAIGVTRFVDHIEPFLKTSRVRGKVALIREYLSKQRMGSRDPEYRASMRVYLNRMRQLNKRGV